MNKVFCVSIVPAKGSALWSMKVNLRLEQTNKGKWSPKRPIKVNSEKEGAGLCKVPRYLKKVRIFLSLSPSRLKRFASESSAANTN